MPDSRLTPQSELIEPVFYAFYGWNKSSVFSVFSDPGFAASGLLVPTQ